MSPLTNTVLEPFNPPSNTSGHSSMQAAVSWVNAEEDINLSKQSIWTQYHTVPYPTLPQGGALVQMTGCGLCGSDLDKLLLNKVPAGTILGHELVGWIMALDDNHTSTFVVGDRIVSAHHVPCGTCQYCINHSESMCRAFKSTNFDPGGFAEVVALTAGHLAKTAFKIPDAISDTAASGVEPLACVLKAVERGGAFQQGRVGIVGLGFIGLLAAQCYQRDPNLKYLLGIDPNSQRQQMALEKQWVHTAYAPNDTDLASNSLSSSLDLVFLSILRPETIELSLSLLRDGGTLILFAGAKTSSSLIDLNTLYSREIRIIPSYSPSLTHLNQAADLIFNQEIDIASLMTHTYPLSHMNDAIECYRSGSAIKVLITP